MVHRVNGTVSQLYVDDGHCYISLKGVADPPKDGLFELRQSHPNYNALYSLALTAAVHGYTLSIRTIGEIGPEAYPGVSYLIIDW
jgi:hypothetical protein